MITAPEVKLNLADGGSHCSTLPNTGLYGGYPPPPIRIHTCTPEGVKKRIGEKKELVHGRGDRENPEILKISESKVKLDIRAPKIGMISLEQYSIVDIEGGSPGGLGDPLERDPELVKRDLEKGYTTVNTARSTWGVKCDEYDKKKKKYMIDYEGTQKLRDELRARRKKRSVPFKEWWKKEREKILKKELEEPVIRMFKEAVGLSSAYDLEVREFWCLPADFQF
jgi:hypothetical protein